MRGMAPALTWVLVLVLGLGVVDAEEKYADEWLGQPVDDATFENYLEFFVVDHEEPLLAEPLGSSENDGVRKEEWSFTSTPGERVYAQYFEGVATQPESRRAILALPGGSGKDNPWSQRAYESYARAGFSVLAIDMKYWGSRATELLTTYTEDERHDRLYNRPALYLDWMIQSVKDVQRSVDFLLTVKDVAPERIALAGMSRGAVVATIAGAVEKRFATVLLLHGGHFDAKEREHLPAACPANYVGRIAPVPLFIVNGSNDSDFVPETSSRPLFRHAREPKEHIWTDGGHAQMRDSDRAAMMEWLRAHLN